MLDTNPILEQAINCYQAGLSVIPVHPGEKRPALPTWKQYQEQRPSLEQVITWFTQHPEWGLGVATGKVSGNLEMVELEGRAAHLEYDICEMAGASGLGELVARLAYQNWTENTPSGGIHYFYRTLTPPAGNTRLALSPSREVLAETRGEGGFVVLAPTGGSHHPSGNPWETRCGGPNQILTLSEEEHEAVLLLFKALNQFLPPDPGPQLAPSAARNGVINQVMPGEDYETKTSWREILTPHGWTPVHQQGDTVYWRRPGKTSGISATTGHCQDRDRLYVFSTSTVFDAEVPYTKFGAYAVLNHGGDYSEAARCLSSEGYGQLPRQLVPTIPGSLTAAAGTAPSGLVTLEDALGEPSSKTPPPAPTSGVLEVSAPAHTEDYDALWFAEQYEHQIAYCPEWGKWLTWDSHAWQPQPEGGGYVRELAKQLYRQIPTNTKQDAAYKIRVLGRAGITNRLAMAQTDLRLVVKKTILDQHPYQLNTPRGIIDLKTGQLTPPDPAMWHTKTTLVAPEPQETPMWDRFLTQTFNGDQQIIDYMQRLAGYSATGVVTDHILPFLHGPGGNGKSVFLDTLTALLGDYATSAPARFLMAGQASHETEIARLDGQRLVICSEINEQDRFDEAKVKLLTGGDRLTARYMRQDYFTFSPTHKLWLMGNHQPKVSSGGPSFWRRLQLIGFTHCVSVKEIIENLDQKLIEAEGAGILQWVIDGAVKYLNNGLGTPESVKTASKEYAVEEDSLSRFVDECLIVGGGEYARVSSAELYRVYIRWCGRENENELSHTGLARALRNTYNLGKRKSNGKNFFTNVSLANTGDEAPNTPWGELGGGQ